MQTLKIHEVKVGFADAKATFESISMIHIYSLQSHELPDLNALVDVSRDILTSFGSEDPLELGKQWGMIQNQHVKRRKLGKPPLPIAVPAPKAEASKKDVPKKEVAQPKAEPEVSSTESSQQKAQTKATEKAPARRKGDLFSSFANAKPKLKKEDSAASSVQSVSTLEVTQLTLTTLISGSRRPIMSRRKVYITSKMFYLRF